MSIRRITASLAALAVSLVVPITMAEPASAGADPTVVSWSRVATADPNVFTCSPSTRVVRANPGSSVTLHNNCIGSSFIINPGGGRVRIDYLGQATISAPLALGTYTIDATSLAIPSVTLVVTDSPINEPFAHDEFQQVGVPASGDCVDVDPITGHYPGYPIGGWSKSWAQWINDGTGGPVCTREVEQRPDGTIVLIG
jgi:hypothetical protein